MTAPGLFGFGTALGRLLSLLPRAAEAFERPPLRRRSKVAGATAVAPLLETRFRRGLRHRFWEAKVLATDPEQGPENVAGLNSRTMTLFLPEGKR